MVLVTPVGGVTAVEEVGAVEEGELGGPLSAEPQAAKSKQEIRIPVLNRFLERIRLIVTGSPFAVRGNRPQDSVVV